MRRAILLTQSHLGASYRILRSDLLVLTGVKCQLRADLHTVPQLLQCGFGSGGFLSDIIRQRYGFRSLRHHRIDAIAPVQLVSGLRGSGNHLSLRNLVIELLGPVDGELERIKRLLRLILRFAHDVRHGNRFRSLGQRDGNLRVMGQSRAGIHA